MLLHGSQLICAFWLLYLALIAAGAWLCHRVVAGPRTSRRLTGLVIGVILGALIIVVLAGDGAFRRLGWPEFIGIAPAVVNVLGVVIWFMRRRVDDGEADG